MGCILVNTHYSFAGKKEEKYPDLTFFCDYCESCLSVQNGFTDWGATWECTDCGYVNTIIDNDAYLETAVEKNYHSGYARMLLALDLKDKEAALDRFEEAISLFKKAENYKNSKELIERCKDQIYLISGKRETISDSRDESPGNNESFQSQIQVGDVIYLGRIQQYDDFKQSKDPIEWVVIKKDKNKALLLSSYVLFFKPYNEKKTTWYNSELRRYLNNIFFNNSFSLKEKEAIVYDVINNQTEKNKQWDTDAGAASSDRIFCLSYQEFMNYVDRYLKTAVATLKSDEDLYKEPEDDYLYYEVYWWLRSPGKKQGKAIAVDFFGDILSEDVDDTFTGVRPALWLDLKKYTPEADYAKVDEAFDYFDEGNYYDAYRTFDEVSGNEGYFENIWFWSFESLASHFILNEDVSGFHNDYEALLISCLNKEFNKNDEWSKRMIRSWRFLGGSEQVTCYNLAKKCLEKEDDEKAFQLLSYLGNYEDSKDLLDQISAKMGIQSYYVKANKYITGNDNGYLKRNSIPSDDRHYGWDLGQFVMSNFTRVTKGESDNPIFLKTLGDSITLSFELEQDIGALDDKKDLKISNDKDGYDQEFELRKTKNGFGYGALIVRHTDYQNRMHDPVIYTNYLKNENNALSSIQLNEEGDYEVALDYEIVDNSILHIANKKGNYSMRFHFSIRNGNCTVFPFDIKTNQELKNTFVTENGFYLDLAKSRYLEITVKRTVLALDGDSGYVEDERFNRAAKDGDKYTEEGIYTIMVKNVYTDEKTTKTIFVGSQSLLDEYVKKGFSMDRLK